MGRFIILDKSIPRDPKLVNAAEKLAPRVRISIDGKDLSEDEVRHALRHAGLGVTVTLWSRADVEIRRDNALPWSVTGVQQEIGCHAEFLKMLPSQWVRVRSDGLVELPGYVERNKLIPIEERKQVADHKRELARVRKQRQRERERLSRMGHERDKNPVTQVTRDSHACHADTGTSTGIPIPISEERDSSRHQPPGSLASAIGASLACASKDNGQKPKATAARHTEQELESFAMQLHRESGMNALEISGCMKNYGTTAEQVEGWIQKAAAQP